MTGPQFRGDDGGVGERPRQSGGEIDGFQPRLAAAGLLTARAKTVEARRIRHPDRRTASRGRLHCPRAQSAPAYAVFVLVAEGLGGIDG
jgi:hypothetical protein